MPEEEDHGSTQLAMQARKLDLFWSGLRPVLDSGPPQSKLHDVVQLSYAVPGLTLPFLTEDTEAEVSVSLTDGHFKDLQSLLMLS